MEIDPENKEIQKSLQELTECMADEVIESDIMKTLENSMGGGHVYSAFDEIMVMMWLYTTTTTHFEIKIFNLYLNSYWASFCPLDNNSDLLLSSDELQLHGGDATTKSRR